MSQQLILGLAFGGGGRKDSALQKRKVKLWRKHCKNRLCKLYVCPVKVSCLSLKNIQLVVLEINIYKSSFLFRL